MFVMSDNFDTAMIFFIRNLTTNFIISNRTRSINGFPIEMASGVEEDPQGKTLDEYIKNILMKMGREAQGFLFYVISIALRISVLIVDIDTSLAVMNYADNEHIFKCVRCDAEYNDISVYGEDSLNFHNETLFIMRKNNQYFLLY